MSYVNYPTDAKYNPSMVLNQPSLTSVSNIHPTISNIQPAYALSGDVIFNGEKLSDIITEIRDALYIITRDKDREEKYSELKAAAEEYYRILERLTTMELLVGKDNVE